MTKRTKKLLLFAALCCFAHVPDANAAGFDLTLFGYKLFDVSFDANPFSRDDGRKKTSTETTVRKTSVGNTGNGSEERIYSADFTIIDSDKKTTSKEYRYDGPPIYYPSPYYSGSYRHWGWGGYYRRTR